MRETTESSNPICGTVIGFRAYFVLCMCMCLLLNIYL